MKRRTACLLFTLLGSTPALAQPATPGATTAERQVAEVRTEHRYSSFTHPSAYEHDGFYLRAALGFGGLTDHIFRDNRDPDAGLATGAGSAFEVAAGVTVDPQWIVGGGVYGFTSFASAYTHGEGDEVPMELRSPRSLVLVGPFLDWYFARNTGFHAQGAVGFAALTGLRWEQTHADDEVPALGGGFMLGVGHEWWVHEQWGIGALVRVTGAALVEDVEGRDWMHVAWTLPSLLLTATYN